MTIGQRALVAGVLTLVVTATPAGLAQIGPKFYDDDPLLREPETQDASNVQERDNSPVLRLDPEPLRDTGRRSPHSRPECEHDRRGPGFELVHEPNPRPATLA